MRVDCPGSIGGDVPSSPIQGALFAGTVRSMPSWRRSMPNAWQSFAGPLQSAVSGRMPPRAALIAPMPASGRERTQQHRDAVSFLAAHGVRAPVHAVGEVHVQVARRAEHRGVAGRQPSVRVARRIVRAEVRLDLDDAGAAGPADEHLVEQVGRDLACVAAVEVPAERLQCDSASRTSAGTGVGVFFLGTTLT